MPTHTQWHRHKYLESQTQAQTCTALKKKIMFVMKSKLKKTYESWMKSVIQSYINLFLIKTKENVKIGTLFPTLL